MARGRVGVVIGDRPGGLRGLRGTTGARSGSRPGGASSSSSASVSLAATATAAPQSTAERPRPAGATRTEPGRAHASAKVEPGRATAASKRDSGVPWAPCAPTEETCGGRDRETPAEEVRGRGQGGQEGQEGPSGSWPLVRASRVLPETRPIGRPAARPARPGSVRTREQGLGPGMAGLAWAMPPASRKQQTRHRPTGASRASRASEQSECFPSVNQHKKDAVVAEAGPFAKPARPARPRRRPSRGPIAGRWPGRQRDGFGSARRQRHGLESAVRPSRRVSDGSLKSKIK